MPAFGTAMGGDFDQAEEDKWVEWVQEEFDALAGN
jgi:hypothetical protein